MLFAAALSEPLSARLDHAVLQEQQHLPHRNNDRVLKKQGNGWPKVLDRDLRSPG